MVRAASSCPRRRSSSSWPASGLRSPTLANVSSSTWSRTSTSSSTSDAPGPAARTAGPAARTAGLVRLVHPFPSALDALVVAAVSLVAGGAPATAVRLGVAMFALQASIGAVNDVVDERRDWGLKPGKPIPSGLVSRSGAKAVAVAAALTGVALAGASGAGTLMLAVVVLAIGYVYDRFAKGTAWSWVPFAVGIPLLPVFGWYGTTGDLAPVFRLLVPVAVVTGAALAIANARADAERDVAAGIDSVAIRLGPRRSWLVATALLGAIAAIAILTLVAWNAPLAAVLGALAGVSIVRYFARFARSVAGIEWRTPGSPITPMNSSTASVRFCLALMSESSVIGAAPTTSSRSQSSAVSSASRSAAVAGFTSNSSSK